MELSSATWAAQPAHRVSCHCQASADIVDLMVNPTLETGKIIAVCPMSPRIREGIENFFESGST